MPFINFGKRTINFKIVYYGPARSGKTTNLEQVHEQVNPELRGELTMLSTHQDRTLFFDFLPLRSEIISDFTSKFQLYTVPGQVIYNQTRKLVLKGVDGIVFVADSAWHRMEENVDSFNNLEGNLQEQDMSLDSTPFIIQFNKRDLADKAPVHYMDFLLNQCVTHVPSCEATASEGEGVFEALNLIARMTIAGFARKNKLRINGEPTGVCVKEERGADLCSVA